MILLSLEIEFIALQHPKNNFSKIIVDSEILRIKDTDGSFLLVYLLPLFSPSPTHTHNECEREWERPLSQVHYFNPISSHPFNSHTVGISY